MADNQIPTKNNFGDGNKIPKVDQKEQDKTIVDKLTSEGDLLRNSGANSIKTLKADLNKFQDIFDTVNKTLLEQTSVMRETLGVLVSFTQGEDIKDKLKEFRDRIEQDDKRDRERDNPKPTPTEHNNDSSPFGFGLLGGVVGSLGNIGSLVLRNVGKLGLAAIVAPIISGILGKVVTNLLNDNGFTSEFANSIGDSVGATTLGALVGSVFSKRLGLLFAGAGFMSSLSDELLTSMGLTEEEMTKTIATVFGKDIDMKNVTSVLLGSIGLGVTALITNPTFIGKIVSTVGSLGLSGLGKGVGLALGGLYFAYNDKIKEYLADAGAPEAIGNVADFTVAGASLGSLFGPQGALVGAAIGFAMGIGKSLFDWLSGIEKDSFEKIKKDLDKLSGDELSVLYAKGGAEAVAKGAVNGEYLDNVSRDKVYKEIETRMNTAETAATTSSIMTDTSKGGSELATKDNINNIADLFYSGKFDKEKLNSVYGNLLRVHDEMSNIMKSAANDPSNEYLQNQANNYKFAFEDIQTLLDDMKKQGASVSYKFGEVIPMIPKSADIQSSGYPSLLETSKKSQSEISPVLTNALGKLGIASEKSMATTSNSIMFAPNINQVTNNVKGGTNSSSTNVFGTGGANGLDTFGLPKGAH